jgi:hypothetical protein
MAREKSGHRTGTIHAPTIATIPDVSTEQYSFR